jgi:hypothetical protein
MQLTIVCTALALSFGCRERALAQAPPHEAGAGSGTTVIIEIPPPPVDARGVDYAAPLNIDPGAPPGTLGNGKAVPRNTAPDAAPRD